MIRLVVAALALSLVACRGGEAGAAAQQPEAAATPALARAEVSIDTANGPRVFHVDVARTPAEQSRGLMFRTDIPRDGGMIFTPYPAAGGGPQEASFWMKNTPSPLDIIFIRADGTIARIAENTVPFSEAPIPSGEPVATVLEINGGRAAETGVAEGDRVRWTIK